MSWLVVGGDMIFFIMYIPLVVAVVFAAAFADALAFILLTGSFCAFVALLPHGENSRSLTTTSKAARRDVFLVGTNCWNFVEP